jgi:hypothetical protein
LQLAAFFEHPHRLTIFSLCCCSLSSATRLLGYPFSAVIRELSSAKLS